MFQDGSKMLSDSLKPQDGHKMAQDGLKRAPDSVRMVQTCSKRLSDSLKMVQDSFKVSLLLENRYIKEKPSEARLSLAFGYPEPSRVKPIKRSYNYMIQNLCMYVFYAE